MSIKINVSNIAAFIGEHPYKSQAEAFKQTAEDQGLIKRDYITEAYIQSLIPLDILKETVNSTAVQLEHNIALYEHQVKNKVISDIMQNTEHLQVPADVKKRISLYNNIETSLQDPVVADYINNDQTIKTVCCAVNTHRGIQLESASTDKFQNKFHREVTNRNTKCYIKKCENFVLAGRCDGFMTDAVVETKTRRRYWRDPPEYDIIQLRAYMKLCDKKVGYLNEQFPDGTSRSTKVIHDEEEWSRIESAIKTALESFWLTI